MALKLTKNQLRAEQQRLNLLQKYLPTLQLKKALLQAEVSEANAELDLLTQDYLALRAKLDSFSTVLTDPIPFKLDDAAKIAVVQKHYDNIAGVEVPYFDAVEFVPFDYHFFDTPVWVDSAIHSLRNSLVSQAKIEVGKEKKKALEKELREVSIRVNLFEKILIPRAEANIKKIKVFLGDQQLSSVCRAKVAKAKIIQAKEVTLS